MSSDWQFCSTNIKNTPMSSVDPVNPLAAPKENLSGSSSCSSAPTVDAFSPPALWDQPTRVQNQEYRDINLQNDLSGLNTLGGPKVGIGPASLGGDISWKPPISMLKDGYILANALDALPESLTQFPVDSGFIERAARFSCFGGGCFSDMLNPFGGIESLRVCPQGMVRMPVPVQGQIFPMDSVKLLPPQRNGFSTVQVFKDAALPSMPENCGAGQLKTEGRSENLVQSNDEQTKQVVCGSTDSDGPEISGDGARDGKGFGSNKRKRNRLPAENVKDINETQQRVDQSPNSAPGKAAGKNNKQESRTLEPTKEGYIHVRARRGQATNSHSLAERVRREKISQRMKFLQDLVPGCSKVTGKALMLDEIINYVQLLQQQVEFLSMKLATVNPQLDFNIEGLLANDTLHSRAGHSSTLGLLPPDMLMPYPPPLHPPLAGLIQAGLNAMGGPESLRRNLHNQINPVGGGGFKDPAQLQNIGEDEFNNVNRMGFKASAPLSSQDNSDGSV